MNRADFTTAIALVVAPRSLLNLRILMSRPLVRAAGVAKLPRLVCADRVMPVGGDVEYDVKLVREMTGNSYDAVRFECAALGVKVTCYANRNDVVDVTDFGATLAHYRMRVGDAHREPNPWPGEQAAAGGLERGRSLADAVVFMLAEQLWTLKQAEEGYTAAQQQQRRLDDEQGHRPNVGGAVVASQGAAPPAFDLSFDSPVARRIEFVFDGVTMLAQGRGRADQLIARSLLRRYPKAKIRVVPGSGSAGGFAVTFEVPVQQIKSVSVVAVATPDSTEKAPAFEELGPHCVRELRAIARAPKPRRELNPGVAAKLERQGLVTVQDLPNPYPSSRKKQPTIQHLVLTDAGRFTAERI